LLRRHYPASSLIRACPSPQAARSVPRGLPVGRHERPPPGASRVALGLRVPACRRQYPGGTTGSRRFTGCDPQFPSDGGLPRYVGGSAPTSFLSGPARRSLALRPARSPGRRGDPLSRRLRRFRYLCRRSDSFRLERLSSPGGTRTHWNNPHLFTSRDIIAIELTATRRLPNPTASPAAESLTPATATYPRHHSRRKIADALSHPAPVARLMGLGNDPTGPWSGALTTAAASSHRRNSRDHLHEVPVDSPVMRDDTRLAA
jgi:hypothetical protein